MLDRNTRWQRCKSQRSLFSRFLLSLTVNRVYGIREDFAARYLVGEGYEIGAQKSPLKCKFATNILYIDYLSREESAQKYGIPARDCVDVDIIADANELVQIPSESASFIIANHVLEHSPNPIATLNGWLRILRIKGILFLTLPNAQSNEYDFEREPVACNHFHSDYIGAMDGEDIMTKHICEHIRVVDGISPSSKKFKERLNEIIESGLHPHYHVFTPSSTLEMLSLVHVHSPIKVKSYLAYDNCFELIYVIEKIASGRQKFFEHKHDLLFTIYLFAKHVILYIFGKPFWSILFHIISRKR